MLLRVHLLLALVLFSLSAAEEKFPLPSNPYEVAALTSSHEWLIGDLIHPLLGQPLLQSTDLIANGAQEIALRRQYVAPLIPASFDTNPKIDFYHLYQHLSENYRGWALLPHLRLYVRGQTIRYADPSGLTLEFTQTGPHHFTLTSSQIGMSNTVCETPSGCHDPRNIRLQNNSDNSQIRVFTPDGTSRIYRKKNNTYLLEKELLPNGKVLRYTYNNNLELTQIESRDSQERYTYAKIEVQGSPRTSLERFTTSSGQTATFHFEQRRVKGKNQTKSDKTDYRIDSPPILTAATTPFFESETLEYNPRFLLETARLRAFDFRCEYANFGHTHPLCQVYRLLLPCGPSDTFLPLYEIDYQLPVPGLSAGSTHVQKQDGTSISYHFNQNLLLNTLQTFDAHGNLSLEKRLHWTQNNWLAAVELFDNAYNLLKRTSYEYDRFGNPIRETLSGDLTGDGTLTSTTIRRQFSEDGRHLLLREEHENGAITHYTYLPQSNLLRTKFTGSREQILQRELYEYDDAYNLVRKICDDGSTTDPNNLIGVTERRITEHILRTDPPFLHMPEWIVEKYIENNQETLLKKTHLSYDHHGHVARETVYDAEARESTTLPREYNARGDLVTETNPLGQLAKYDYDARGRRVRSTNFAGTLTDTMYYDAKGRLTLKQTKAHTGETQTLRYTYDPFDHLIEKTDELDNTTHFLNDPLTGGALQTTYPPIENDQGQTCTVSTRAQLDPLGRTIAKTDANGHTTHFRYNTYGSPSEIHYPDGTSEHFRYSLEGQLLSHTNLEDLLTTYSYDLLNRPTSITYFFDDSLPIAKEICSYSSFHLIKSTDREGHLTHYTYDGVGRISSENHAGKLKSYTYDPFGRVATITQHDTTCSLTTHFTYDLHGHLCEERKTDRANTLLSYVQYSFDADDNLCSITRPIQDNIATETFVYDPFHRLLEHRSPQGHTTQSTYEIKQNNLRQNVWQTTQRDPQNNLVLQTQDAHGRIIQEQNFDANLTPLSTQTWHYDPAGNLLQHMHNNTKTTYAYDTRQRPTKITSTSSTTQLSYTPLGKPLTKTLPTGTTLHHTYTPLGFLKTLTSSDGQIHHTFLYNRLGHLLRTTDINSRESVLRLVDPFGNILQETLSFHTLEKTYDNLDRPLTLTLPAHIQLRYEYDPLHLRSVTRYDGEKKLYSHTFNTYDLSGHLLRETLIDGQSICNTTYDLHGNILTLSSPYFTQQCTYNPNNHLTQNLIDNIPQPLAAPPPATADLTYDPCGNLICKHTPTQTQYFTYDPLNRLLEASTDNTLVKFTYDPLGRRLSRTLSIKQQQNWKIQEREFYLYDLDQEIGAFFADGSPKQLRLLSPTSKPIAIELQNTPYATLLDTHANICKLLDPSTHKITSTYLYTPCSETTPAPGPNPWRLHSLRFDPILQLLYDGPSYYDPTLQIYLTPSSQKP